MVCGVEDMGCVEDTVVCGVEDMGCVEDTGV